MNIKRLIEFIIIFLLILDTGSIPSVFFSGGVISVCVIILSFLYCTIYGCGISRSQLILLVGFSLFFILSSVFTHTSVLNYISIIIRIIAVVLVFSVFNNKTQYLQDTLTKVLKFVAYLGAINYILINFFPFLFSLRSAEGGFSINTFLYFFNFHSYIQIGPFSLLRNQGMFWEPGVFQIPMNLLLYLLLIVKQKTLLQAILPIVMVISTFSTTGLIVMSLIIFFKTIRNKKSIPRIDKFILIIFILILMPLVYENVNQKLTGDSSESAAARTFDLYMGMDVIVNNPIWGIGPNPEKYITLTKDLDIGIYDNEINSERGNTNTIISFICYLGIPFSFYFFRMLYRQRIFPQKKLFFMILIIMLFSEPLFGTAILFLISMSAKLNKDYYM